MAWYSALIKIFSGSAGNIVDSLSDAVDKFVTTDEEKAKLKIELDKLMIDQQKNSFEFQKQMEELSQKREEQLEKSIRSELEAKSQIIMAEMQQDDKFTKRARPTVIYVGLVFIFLEMFGLRYLILNSIEFDNLKEIIDSSESIFETFLLAWGGVVGTYAVGRSLEKRGVKNKLTSAITGSAAPAIDKLKEISRIKW